MRPVVNEIDKNKYEKMKRKAVVVDKRVSDAIVHKRELKWCLLLSHKQEQRKYTN